MTTRSNTVEKGIVVASAYVIAVLVLVVLRITETLPNALVFVALAVPLALVAANVRLRGSLLVAVLTSGIGVPFLLRSGGLLIGALFAVNLCLASIITLVVGRREAMRTHWRRSHSLDDRHDDVVFEGSLNTLHFIDREGTILRRNEASRGVLGHMTKRSLQLSEYVHPEELDRMKTELMRLFERGEIRDIKTRFMNERREQIPVDLRGLRISDRMALIEAHDRRQMAALERRLMEAEARYRFLIEAAVDTLDSGIIISDRRHHVVWANETIGRFFGIDRDRVIGIDSTRAFARFIGVFENCEEVSRVVEQAIETRTPVESYTCRVKPGMGRDERVLAYRSIPVDTERYRGGRIDHFIDITEIKRLEEGLLEKTQGLQRTLQKLEEFSYVVSHDLKEPLRTVEAFSGFLIEDYSDKLDEEGNNYLQTLRKTSGRMRALINDLLSLSSIHIDSASAERIPVSRLLEETREDLEMRLRGVNLRIDEDLPTVVGSEVRIGELFSNLIVNAIKYNDKALPTLHVGWTHKESRNGMCTFFVKDNGIGIESRYRERIFGIFEKLNPRKDVEGTGAGLAICKRIVEEHGGDIWVESEVGVGSTFFFTLPRATARSEVETHA